ncbi:MAG TPA: hypothetical protein VM658_16970 [bacterium]|nr:hypothetical protein [bacterium]
MKHFFLRAAVLAQIIALCLVAASCWKGEQGAAENKLPEVSSVKLTPASIQPGDSVYASVQARDMEGDQLTYEYQWIVNGKPAEGARDKMFSTDGLAPGDQIFVKARAVETSSGRAGKWKESKKISLGEFPPLRIQGVVLEPESIKATGPVEAVIDYGDLDPNDVDTVYYRWNVNGTDLLGEENHAPSLSPGQFSRGDRIMVTVCLDGLFKSPNTWSSSVYTVADTAPEFTSSPDIGYDQDKIVIYFEVEDPDGDSITYSISGAPPGSYLDKKDGTKLIISANAPPGTYNIMIGASDNYGGSTGKPIVVTIPER